MGRAGIVAGTGDPATGTAGGLSIPANSGSGCAVTACMAASILSGPVRTTGRPGTISFPTGTVLPCCGRLLPPDRAVSFDPEPACACRSPGLSRSGKLPPSWPVCTAVPAGSVAAPTSIGSGSDCWSWNGIRVPLSCPRWLPVSGASSVPDHVLRYGVRIY